LDVDFFANLFFAAELRAHFQQFGVVTEAQVLVDRQTGRHRGFGFVTFESELVASRLLGTTVKINGKDVRLFALGTPFLAAPSPFSPKPSHNLTRTPTQHAHTGRDQEG
jgi:hypothetical protein